MTFCTVQEKKKTFRNAGLLTLGLTVLVVSPSMLHQAMASYYVQPPYENYRAYPMPYGGCDFTHTWCDYFLTSNGLMNLFDFAMDGDSHTSEIQWNGNPIPGNSPAWDLPYATYVYWDTTWSAVGDMEETYPPFYGEYRVGSLIVECMDTTPGCHSGSYKPVLFLGRDATTIDPTSMGTPDLVDQDSHTYLIQDINHLYTALPEGYASAESNNCGMDCYGEGYTDFDLSGHYMQVNSISAYPMF